jgi:hypothetical protein
MEEESKLTKSTNKQKVIMQMRGAKKWKKIWHIASSQNKMETW